VAISIRLAVLCAVVVDAGRPLAQAVLTDTQTGSLRHFILLEVTGEY
jgi:hypothetical protein